MRVSPVDFKIYLSPNIVYFALTSNRQRRLPQRK